MSKKSNSLIKIKRGFIFAFGLLFFLFPGQNYYLVVQAQYQPNNLQFFDLAIPPIAPYPIKIKENKPVDLTAKSVLILDQNSSVVIYAKNEKAPFLPASLVKTMTALVVLDYYPLEQILTFKDTKVLGQKMKLVEGEKMRVEDLLYGLLVFSANDAALALAQNYPGGEANFVSLMNKKAQDLHLKNSFFANPTGLDSDQQGKFLNNYSFSSAWDLAQITKKALENPAFREMVATKEKTVTNISGKLKHQLFNLNELLGKIEGVKGVKTGWTQDAGECLVALAKRGEKEVIVITLAGQNRFGETAYLIDWVFSHYQWKNLIPSI